MIPDVAVDVNQPEVGTLLVQPVHNEENDESPPNPGNISSKNVSPFIAHKPKTKVITFILAENMEFA